MISKKEFGGSSFELGKTSRKGGIRENPRMGVVSGDSCCCCCGGRGREVEGKQVTAVRGSGAPVNEAGGSL